MGALPSHRPVAAALPSHRPVAAELDGGRAGRTGMATPGERASAERQGGRRFWWRTGNETCGTRDAARRPWEGHSLGRPSA